MEKNASPEFVPPSPVSEHFPTQCCLHTLAGRRSVRGTERVDVRAVVEKGRLETLYRTVAKEVVVFMNQPLS